MFPAPPKYLKWDARVQQIYHCNKSLLITSGCSFTASTTWFGGPASWPGYVKDRCGFDLAIDMSYPGLGNVYIADSVKYCIENLIVDAALENLLVMIMWSGLDRIDRICDNSNKGSMLGNKCYIREDRLIEDKKRSDTTNVSYQKIMELRDYLDQRSISWVFMQYANMLFPPFIPKGDTTHHFPDYLSRDKISKLRSISWVPKNPIDYLYEWAWKNETLDKSDGFHPSNESNFKWTDEVLLPELEQKGMIIKLEDRSL